MGVICSGHPSSGTHLLVKCFVEMGYERVPGSIVWDVKKLNNKRVMFNHWDYKDQTTTRIWDKERLKIPVVWDSLDFWLDFNLDEMQCIHAHAPFFVPGHHNIIILRDPRNVLLSRWRREIMAGNKKLSSWNCNELSKEGFFQWMLMKGSTFIRRIRQYLFIDGTTVYVTYENFHKDKYLLANMFQSKAPQNLEGGTLTYVKEHSDYKTLWSDEIDDLWKKLGGNKLLEDMNFAPHYCNYDL